MSKTKPLVREDPRLVRLGANLAAMRKIAGISSQSDMAKRTGINQSTLYSHMSDIRSMRIGELLAIMDACGQKEVKIG